MNYDSGTVARRIVEIRKEVEERSKKTKGPISKSSRVREAVEELSNKEREIRDADDEVAQALRKFEVAFAALEKANSEAFIRRNMHDQQKAEVKRIDEQPVEHDSDIDDAVYMSSAAHTSVVDEVFENNF